MENTIEITEAIAPGARWGIEKAVDRKEEGVRTLRGARAARVGKRERERAIGVQQGQRRLCATSESRVTRG